MFMAYKNKARTGSLRKKLSASRRRASKLARQYKNSKLLMFASLGLAGFIWYKNKNNS